MKRSGLHKLHVTRPQETRRLLAVQIKCSQPIRSPVWHQRAVSKKHAAVKLGWNLDLLCQYDAAGDARRVQNKLHAALDLQVRLAYWGCCIVWPRAHQRAAAADGAWVDE